MFWLPTMSLGNPAAKWQLPFGSTKMLLLLLLSTPLHQRAASRVQHPNHVAANILSPQVARKGSTLSGFVQRSRLEREVGRDLHSNKWEEV